MNKKNILFPFFSVIFSLIILFMLGEVGTRVWLVYRPESIKQSTRYKYSPYLPYVTTPNYKDNRLRNIEHNDRGFRNSYDIEIPKPNNVYRIACLGGSTTYSDYDYATNEQIWTGRFEYYLNMDSAAYEKTFQVINASAHNYTTYMNFIDYLTRLRDLELDMVIIYEGTNELYFNGYEDISFAHYNVFKQVPFDKVNRKIDYYNSSKLFKYSKLIKKLYKRLVLGRLKSLNEMSTNHSHYNSRNNIENMKNNSLITFQKGLEGFFAISKMDDFKLIFLSQAYNYAKVKKSIIEVANNKLLEQELSDIYINESKRINDLMKKIANKYDIYFLNMTEVLNQNDKYFFKNPRDGVHFSILGEDYFASSLYQFIKENKIIKY